MFTTLSTVLHLGEISFVGVGNNDAAHVKNDEALQKGKYINCVSYHLVIFCDLRNIILVTPAVMGSIY